MSELEDKIDDLMEAARRQVFTSDPPGVLIAAAYRMAAAKLRESGFNVQAAELDRAADVQS